MFSYRHGFHAGNHADVLKHSIVLHVLRYLLQKPTPLLCIDTHSGAGAYSLQSEWAQKSAESRQGILHLLHWASQGKNAQNGPELIRDYLETLQRFDQRIRAEALAPDAVDTSTSAAGPLQFYPGSPALLHDVLREHGSTQSRLRLFELHRNEALELQSWCASTGSPESFLSMQAQDGFKGLLPLLPPPQRRGLVLIDPPYEDKGDYDRVIYTVRDAIKRFATGVYVIWHPILQRLDAQQMPLRLAKLGRPWLHARLHIRGPQAQTLTGSGVFIINPPYTLEPALKSALPVLCQVLQQDKQASWQLDAQLS